MIAKITMIFGAIILALASSTQAGVIPAAYTQFVGAPAAYAVAPAPYAIAPAAYAVAPYASSYSAHSVNHAVAAPVVHAAPFVHAPARLVAPGPVFV